MKNQDEVNKVTNYHGEKVIFEEGQTVTHVTDDGALVKAVVNSLFDGGETLELSFEDGEEGCEEASTCF